jgi:hypothetical protein
MKKLILLLLIIPFASSGQLKGTLTECVQCDTQGGKLDYAVYISNVKTDHWVIFAPGTGEMGDGAGGKLPSLYKYGYPRLVKSGIDLPFNMLMIQPVGYDGWKKNQLGWFKLKFNPSKTILMGLSLGAICVLDQMTNDPFNIISGIVSLSGKPSGGSDAVPRMVSVPGYCFYGSNDTQVSYSTGIKFFNAYNSAHTGTQNVFFMDVQPVGHCCWDSVMTMDGKLMSWIQVQFGPEEPDNEYSKGYIDGLDKAKSSIDSIINVTLSK